MMARRRNLGRKNGPRTKSGRLVTVPKPLEEIVPIAAIVRRAEACDMDAGEVLAQGKPTWSALRIETAGTALGRLQWRHLSGGSRERRMVTTPHGKVEEMVTDEMSAAAEEYRALWVEWYRATGLPRRHPQGQQFERRDRGGEAPEPSPERMKRMRDKLADVEAALDACHPRKLVWATIDSVVIDGVLPAGMEFGERSAALHALRDGLQALTVLIMGRRRAA